MAMSTLAASIPASSSATAIIVPGTPTALSVSFKQLTDDISVFQKQLAQLGIPSGDAVSIALPNSYEFIVSFLATAFQRAIAAPLNPAYKQSEFEFYIEDLSSAVVILPQGAYANDGPAVKAARKYNAAIAECYLNGASLILDVKEQGKLAKRQSQPVARAQPEDVALVLHTSGTTGRPKAVPLTHRNLTRTMQNVRTTYELTHQDRTMLVMPLFHVHGLLAGFLAPLSAGGSVIVPDRFSARTFWDDFLEHKANWYTAVPTIHQILLKGPAPSPKPKIRFIRSCSSPLSPKTFRELEETYGAPVLEAYAMTEAAHQMCSNQLPHRGKRKPGSVGIGQGVEVKILNDEGNEVPPGKEGEICIRGENVTKGYLNNEKANKEAFTKAGFFRTGDQGKKDEDGYVYITGRIKELINRGGEKISPIELDHLLAGYPEVSEAVTFAIPSELYGQEVGVAVVPKADRNVTEQGVTEFVASRTAIFKKPQRVWILKEIPKTATGKIQRRKVAESLLAKDEPRARL
ncbi:putative peroxisomal-coenzyme A synthetase [Cladophialophora carrionii]|uniref:Putative peroxisomal-coenzyme A synthetase n=1 Tax=Cladophialophora carrionii TaxID=86049 RepID=A0A1C1CT47_9EURO|nr:putative peroxisomal-coenzyme A synthetase [Cladophialophora carrionii]